MTRARHGSHRALSVRASDLVQARGECRQRRGEQHAGGQDEDDRQPPRPEDLEVDVVRRERIEDADRADEDGAAHEARPAGGPGEPATHDEVAEGADQAAEHADEEQEGDRPAARDLADALARFGQPALDRPAGRRGEEPHHEPSAEPEHEDAGHHAGRGHRPERAHGVGEHAEPVVRRRRHRAAAAGVATASSPARRARSPPHRGPPPRRSPPRMTRQTCAARPRVTRRATGIAGSVDLEQLEVVRAGHEGVVQPGRDGHRVIACRAARRVVHRRAGRPPRR